MCIKIASEGILQPLISDILGNCKPDLVEIANGNQPARDDSPSFIKIDRQARRYTARDAGGEIGENLPIHRSKNDKVVPGIDIKYPRQATAVECHEKYFFTHINCHFVQVGSIFLYLFFCPHFFGKLFNLNQILFHFGISVPGRIVVVHMKSPLKGFHAMVHKHFI